MLALLNTSIGSFFSPLAGRVMVLGDLGFWHWAWFDDKASSVDARTSDNTFMFLWWLCVFWFVLLMGLMFWFCVKWRRKPGVPAPRSASHNTPLEITWTIIPTLLLVVIFFVGFWDYVERIVARGDSTRITLEAQKWNWDMIYANGRVTTELTTMGGRVGEVKIFYVPESTGIQLRMSSKDVIHSFWVPDWRTKCDVFPNRYTAVWFETEALDPSDPEIKVHADKDPNSVGLAFEERYIYQDHMVYCAEYCGDFHSEMMGIVRVVPKHVYEAWVNDPGIDWPTVTGLPGGRPLWEIGELLYTVKGCSSCHTTNGAAGTGPTWDKTATTGWGTDILLADNSRVLFDENYVRNSVYQPGTQLHAGFSNQMTVFTPDSLNERELGAIMAFMMHLADIDMDPAAQASIATGGAASVTPPPANPGGEPPAIPPAQTPPTQTPPVEPPAATPPH